MILDPIIFFILRDTIKRTTKTLTMKTNSFLLLLLCVLLSITSLKGQSETTNPIVDSLRLRLDEDQNDQDRLETLAKLLDEFALKDTKVAERYANDIINISTDINNKNVITGITFIAMCQQYREEIDSSMTTLKYVLAESRKNQNIYGQYRALQLLGNGADALGNVDESEEYFLKGMAMKDLATSENDKNNIEMIFGNNLGNIYTDKVELTQAIKYFEIAAAAAERAGEINNKGVILSNIGRIYGEKKNTKKAIEYFTRARELRVSAGNKFGELIPTLNLMDIYLSKDSIDALLIEVDRGLKLSEEVQIPYFQDFILTYAVKAHVANKDLRKAKKYLDNVMSKLKSDKTALDLKIAIYQAASHYYIGKKDYRRAKQLIDEEDELMRDNDWKLTHDIFLTRKFAIYNALGLKDETLSIFYEYEDLMRASVDKNFEDVGKIEALYTNAENEKKVLLLEKDKEVLAAVSARNKIVAIATLFLGLISLIFLFWSRNKNKIIADRNLQLQSLNNIKDQIFSIIGHDLKKPTLAFRGITKKLNYLIKSGDENRMLAFGNEIEKEALELNNLTDNLLSWALLQKDMLHTTEEITNLQTITNEALSLFSTFAKEKGVILKNNVQDIQAHVDKHILSTILRNLIDNAIKYSDENDVIEIKATHSENLVILSITDTGKGIDNEMMSSLFTLSKGKSTVGTNGEKGTGLGLHLVKELVEKCKGTIDVQSKLGEGTTFNLSIPA